jgi:hypothetical protein
MVHRVPGSKGLFFGFAALSLIFFQFGAKIPVILHIALSAEIASSVTGNPGWGLFFGFLAAILSEIFACLFLLHGDTHIDPPALALVVTFTVFYVFHVLGIFISPPVIAYLFNGILILLYFLFGKVTIKSNV